MTEKNIFVYKLFLSLNISDCIFYLEIEPPLKKVTPHFPSNPPLKVEVLPSPSILKIWLEVQPHPNLLPCEVFLTTSTTLFTFLLCFIPHAKDEKASF